ncbi:unnamed protein product, partial [Closterium sp. NIES-54]
MASPPVLAFDAEVRPVKFDTWLDDLHLFLQLTAKEDISLYDHALGHATAPAATAVSTARSQWQTRDAHARIAIRNSLPIDEREHFGQHKTAQALYTAVVARYSSPASAALGRLSLPYLFPDLASFHTVADLITHLRTSEARFRAAMPDEFLAKNPPPLWLTLYHLVTRLPDTLRSVRDHFLARCPTELTIALLEKELLAAEASIVTVGASRGDPRTPFFEGCSPSPLLPSVASAAAVDLLSAEKVGTASASSRRRSGKGKGGKGGGGDSGVGGGLRRRVMGVRGAEPGGAGSGGTEPWGAEPGGTEPGGTEPRSLESGGPESGGPIPQSPTPGGALSSEQLREWYLQYCSLRRGTSGARRTTGAGASASPPRRELPSRDQIREWYERRCTLRSGAPGVTDPGAASTAAGTAAGAAGPGVGAAAGTEDPGVGAATGAEDPGAGAAAGAVEPGVGGAAGTEDLGSGVGAAAGAGDPGVGAATGAEDPDVGAAAGAEDPGTGDSAGSGVAARRRPYFVPLLQQVLGLPPSTGPPHPLACPQPVQSQLELRPACPLPALSPYTGPTGGLAERREPASRPASPVRTARTSGYGSRLRPPPVPGTHRMSLRLSTTPLRAPLPSPPESSLPALSDPESDSLRAASPDVTRLLATVVTDPSFESTAASALVAELVDFAARCRLDYAASLVAESESVCPPSVGDPDALDIPTPRSYAEAIEGPYSSQWQAAMDAEMASWKSTGTYVDAVPPPGANIVSGMWIFRVKRPPGSPPVFKARYVARGVSQRQGVDYFQTFSPTPKMTTLQGSLHEEIWLRRPPGFTGTSPPGTQWSLRRPVYGLCQAPREWHDTLRTTLAALEFAPSTADPSLFLRTDTSLPPFYIDDLVFATADTAGLAYVKSELQKRHTCTDLGELRSYLGLQITRDRARRTITLNQSHMVQQVLQRFGFTYSSPQATPLPTRHSLSALPSDESVESSGPYPELVGCLMYLMTCTRPDLAYPLSILARYVAPGRHRPEHMAAAKRATQRSSQGYTFSLGSGSVSWRATRSSSVLGSSCEAEIYAGAMAAQELRWLTYLLTDLGEPPRSPPVLYVDNKAMLALCREQRLEHRTKHIALRYFLARELQQRGQLRLAYVASEANTADVFTKALAPCDHQRFCTQLVTDLITHLRTSDTRYRAALPAEFCAQNPLPMYITLYYLVTRLPDTLRSVRDHFLSLCPTTLTVDLLKERLLAAETSIIAVGASRGDPRTPFFEGCSPVPLLPSVASAAVVDLVGT